MSELLPNGYSEFLQSLKAKIQARPTRAILAVNRELIALYWEIGQQIVERQETAGWGDAVITQLERDLKREMPDLKGFSRRSLPDAIALSCLSSARRECATACGTNSGRTIQCY